MCRSAAWGERLDFGRWTVACVVWAGLGQVWNLPGLAFVHGLGRLGTVRPVPRMYSAHVLWDFRDRAARFRASIDVDLLVFARGHSRFKRSKGIKRGVLFFKLGQISAR